MGCIKGVWSATGASTMLFVENIVRQKLQGTDDLVGVGHLFGPQNLDPEEPGPNVLLEPWSLTMKDRFTNQMCSICS